ncbi:unnamed protein product [Effrenium voratum]|nr:unnamed protein product [Effrenium voratum]
MGCVRRVTGEEVMTREEFAKWWNEQHELRDGNMPFVDALRRHLAVQLQIPNFRRLALVRGEDVLRPEDPWQIADLVVVVRQYSTASDDVTIFVTGVAFGDAERLLASLERPVDPERTIAGVILPLYAAADRGHQDVVRILLEAGVDKNRTNSSGDSPMHVEPEVVTCKRCVVCWWRAPTLDSPMMTGVFLYM